MFKRSVGKELTTLKGYRKTVVYIKDPWGDRYLTDTPTTDDIFSNHVARGYHFYEVIDGPYPKEVLDWVDFLTEHVPINNYEDIYDVAENIVNNGYKVVKV